MKELFSNKGAFRLWIAQTVSTFGDFFTYVAILIIVQELTGSALAVSGLVVVQTLPVLLVGPLAGAIADRYDRKKLMICADLLRALLIAVVPFMNQVYLFYAFAFLLSASTVIFSPARNAVLPQLVEKNDLVKINAVFAISDNLARIVGPGAAGLLIAWQGLRIPFWVDSITFVISAIFLYLIAVPLPSSASRRIRIWTSIKEGLLYILRTPIVRTILSVRMLVALGGGAINVLLVVLAKKILGWSDEAFGIALSTIAAGSFIGSVGLSFRGGRFDPRILFSLGTLAVGLSFVGLAMRLSYELSLVLLFIDGLADSAVVISYASLAQKCISNEMRGRFFGTAITLFRSGVLLSAGLSGALAEIISVHYTLMLAGGIVAIGGIYGWVALNHKKENGG